MKCWRTTGTAVNTAGNEYETLPSPGGSRLILMVDGDLDEARKTASGWAKRTRLGPERGWMRSRSVR